MMIMLLLKLFALFIIIALLGDIVRTRLAKGNPVDRLFDLSQNLTGWVAARFSLIPNWPASPARQRLVLLGIIAVVLIAKDILLPAGYHGTIVKCEQGICGFWAFNGTRGESFGTMGDTEYGVNYFDEGPATLRYFSSDAISIETVYKSQVSGEVSSLAGRPAEGAVERYTGRRHGHDLKGTYVIYGNDGKITAKGNWAGYIDTTGATKAYEYARVASGLDLLHWLFLAALQGNAAAANDVGYYYATGGGLLNENYSKASSFFRVAAALGNKNGKDNLHRYYEFDFENPNSNAAEQQRSASGNDNAFTLNIPEQPGLLDILKGLVQNGDACYETPACNARMVQQEQAQEKMEEEESERANSGNFLRAY